MRHPDVLYCYSDAPNPGWTHAYAHQPEIRDSMRRVASGHDVERFMRLPHELIGADFDSERGVWELETIRAARASAAGATGRGRRRRRLGDAWRRRFARHPRLQALARGGVVSLMDALHAGFQHPAVMKLAERRGRAHIARQVPDPELRARLTPDYSLGCTRVLGSDRWYPALREPNVDVVSTAIREVVPDGIVDAQGAHPVDTLIVGTGFHVSDMPIAQRIRGRAGRLLAEAWQGSPRAHLGMSVAGFPNLFFLLGPNTGLGHNSALLMIEAGTDYLCERAPRALPIPPGGAPEPALA